MAANSPQLIVIAGPNGAGKSTLAPFLLRDTFGLTEFVNADTIAQGLSAFRPEAAAMEAGRVMLKRLRDLANQRASFAFESTLASRSHAPWIASLCAGGYSFHLTFLWLQSPELAFERVGERVRLGGHDVPEEGIRRRYYRGMRNFFQVYRGLAKTWAIYDTSVSGPPAIIAAGALGSQTVIHQADSWDRVCETAAWRKS